MDKKSKLQKRDLLRFTCILLLQIVLSSQPLAAQDSLSNQYSLNARGTFKEGQLNQTILSSDGYYSLNSKYYKTEFFVDYSYLITNGRVGENELLSRILISLTPLKRWFPVIGYIYNRSEFYKIKHRHTPGLGMGYKILDHPSRAITLYTWAASDHTDFRNIEGYNTFRLNSFIVGKHQLISELLTLQYTIFYLQSLEKIDNYIWRIKPTLSVRLSRKFSLTINLESHYENIIDPVNTNRNSVMTVGFKYSNI